MAPLVFVRKKSGDIRFCMKYHELNKKTGKDAYPLPRPDEVQDRPAGSSVFSTLDLHIGYWQVPIPPERQPSPLVLAWIFISSVVIIWPHWAAQGR